MSKNIFRHVKISGISTVVPKNEIRLEDELQFFGGDIKKAQRVTKMAGIDRRRVADEGVLPSDLCQHAAEKLFAGLELDRSTIDALVFVSQSPDYVMPATACILQDKLKLPKTCAAFDVNQGCTGYVRVVDRFLFGGIPCLFPRSSAGRRRFSAPYGSG